MPFRFEHLPFVPVIVLDVGVVVLIDHLQRSVSNVR